MKSIKKVTAIVCAAASVSGMTASAEWLFAGYDTSNPPEYGKIYNEYINGRYTSKQKIEPLAPEFVEWRFEGFELDYPHAGYERLHLEGEGQNAITRRKSVFPQWETRYRDFLWEVAGNHQIFQRQQTKINNVSWVWDFGRDPYEDSTLFVPTSREAVVTESFENYGVANLDTEGNYVFDINGNIYDHERYDVYTRFGAMPTPFNVVKDEYGNPTKMIAYGDFFSSENLSQLDDKGLYVITDEMIAEQIDIPKSKFVTGPSYYGENPTKDVATMYYANRDKDWYWDSDTAIITKESVIEWTEPAYETTEPYKYYQYLIVNGVVMDGRNDTPRIWRYTGGKASPDREWRYDFMERDYPFNVVEILYIRDNSGEMVPAYDIDGNPIYRYPEGEFGNTYFKVTDTEIQYWLKSDYDDVMLNSISRVNGDFGSGFSGYMNASEYVEGN